MEDNLAKNCIWTIRPAAEGDYEALAKLCEDRLGAGYLTEEDYKDRIRFPHLNLVADFGGEVGSFVSMTPDTPELLGKRLKLDPENIRKDAQGRPCIRFRTAITSKKYEGHDVLQSLLDRILENAEKDGYGLILSPVWKYHGKAPMVHLHDKSGFINLGEKENLWKDINCIVCQGPCRCTAILYEKIFDSSLKP